VNSARKLRTLCVVGGLLALVLMGSQCRAAPPPVEEGVLRVRVQGVYPHDPAAFTQGLLWHEGFLFESTGQQRESTLRRVDLTSGEVLQERKLSDSVWAEGLARVDDRLIQLSYRAGRAWEYDLSSFEPTREFEYRGEGWGLCYDGGQLWMSNGSALLTRRDPETFGAIGTLTVTSEGRPVNNLNELECAEGWIFANIFTTNRIVRIDPLTGEVSGTIIVEGLLDSEESRTASVLNGIAYDPEREVFFITGKDWPKLFEVTFD